MIYINRPVDGRLVKKINRFLAEVKIDGEKAFAHIPNSGRLTELMIPGAKILLEKADNRERKTPYTLKSILHNQRWVCVDSQTPNDFVFHMAKEHNRYIFKGYKHITREYTLGSHRFDLFLKGEARRPLIVEIKSVTLVENNTAKFPDAPTKRGRSHIESLILHKEEGYDCAIIFVVQRSDAKRFEPNEKTDPEFAKLLRLAIERGITAKALRLRVGRESLALLGEIPIAGISSHK